MREGEEFDCGRKKARGKGKKQLWEGQRMKELREGEEFSCVRSKG